MEGSMSVKQAMQKPQKAKETTQRQPKQGKLAWEKPKMEDVSEEVMAQPYIRFT
jgi:hypothetical protein